MEAASRAFTIVVVSDDKERAWVLLHGLLFNFSDYFCVDAPTGGKFYNESADSELSILMQARGIIQHSPLGWSSFLSAVSLLC